MACLGCGNQNIRTSSEVFSFFIETVVISLIFHLWRSKYLARPLFRYLVVSQGSIIEVNVSDLGLVTTSGKVVWGKFAQVTNNPETDGCINAVLLV